VKIRICIVTMTPELAYQAANHAISNAEGEVEVWIGANSCHIDKSRIGPLKSGLPADVHVVFSEDNEGVVPMMHMLWDQIPRSGYSMGEDDIFCFIHDDCLLLEKNWDGRVVSIFSTQPSGDCIGLVGGTGIGAEDIYKTPYRTIQLGRHNVHSAMVDAESHGRRATGPMKLATADGCALFVRRSFLDKLGGWAWWPEPNHGYDNALACMLRRHGRDMWLLPLVFQHPSPLKLALPEEFKNKHAAERYVARFGQDHEVHERAHRRLYDTFRDVLPFHV
jgi:hypothetical protein